MCVQESELCSTVPHFYVWTQFAFGGRCEVRPNMGGAPCSGLPHRERNFCHLSDSPEAMKWYPNAQRNSHIQRLRKIAEGKFSPEFFQNRRQLMANVYPLSMHFAKTNSTGAQVFWFLCLLGFCKTLTEVEFKGNGRNLTNCWRRQGQ